LAASLPSAPAPAGAGSRFWSPWLVLALCVGLVRFFRLGEWSFWIDEVYTLHDAWQIEQHGRAAWPKNPLGYLIVAAWLRFVEGWPDELELRLLPAVFGWLAIPLTAWAFAGVLGARRAGIAALIVALSSWHVYWSQNARFYTLAQDLALVGGALVMRGLFPTSARGWLASFAPAVGLALALAAALAHPSALLCVPAFVIAACALPYLGVLCGPELVRARRVLVVAGVLGALVAAPWAWRVAYSYFWAKGLDGPGAWLAGARHMALTSGFYVTPVLGTAALLGAWTGLRERAGPDAFVALSCALVALAALTAASLAKVSAQYVFVLLPWLAALATAPFRPGAARFEWTPARTLVLCLLTLPAAVDTALYFGVRHGDRPRWREAFQQAFDQRGEEDLLFCAFAPVAEYYLGPQRRELRHPLSVMTLDQYQHYFERHWARQGRAAWFVVQRELLLDLPQAERRRLERMLASECRLVAVFEVPSVARDLDVWLYRRE
jgi:hypothetical protein